MTRIDVDATVRTLEGGEIPAWISEHLERYRASGGRDGHLWDSSAVGGPGLLPTLLLTTIGRRSGRAYTHPLIYGSDGDRYVIVGSKGGADTQPAWYFNLLEHPQVTLQVASETFAARARLLEGAERSRLWTMMVGIFPNYAQYQAKTTRQIPLFALERV